MRLHYGTYHGMKLFHDTYHGMQLCNDTLRRMSHNHNIYHGMQLCHAQYPFTLHDYDKYHDMCIHAAKVMELDVSNGTSRGGLFRIRCKYQYLHPGEKNILFFLFPLVHLKFIRKPLFIFPPKNCQILRILFRFIVISNHFLAGLLCIEVILPRIPEEEDFKLENFEMRRAARTLHARLPYVTSFWVTSSSLAYRLGWRSLNCR